MSADFKLITKIQGFKDIISVRHKGKANLSGPDLKGDEAELPYGTTLLVSGPPGAGKTTFSMALARSLMMSGQKPAPICYFISSEVNETRLRNMFSPYGWLKKTPTAADGASLRGDPEDGVFLINSGKLDKDNLYVIVPEPAVDRPVPSPEELVNDVFNRISKSLSPTEAALEDMPIIVVVDSITALLKGCVTESDERRQTHEMLHRLRSFFGSRLALTILLAEQDFTSAPESRDPSVEDYLAEIVFRLYHKPLALGRRGRVLEIVKSQGVNLIPGEHSWAIVTDQNHNELFRHEKLQERVKETQRHPEAKQIFSLWATIAIFARPRLQHPSRNADSSEGSISSGTIGLDEMLRRDAEFWLAKPDGTAALGVSKQVKQKDGALRKGSTTLLAGPLGGGKTTLCLQFLMEEHFSGSANGVRQKKGKCLLVALGLDVQSTALRVWNSRNKEKNERGKNTGKLSDWLAILDFTQSHFDFNHLMAHLDWALAEFKPVRIAFDGLSEWLTMFDRADAAKMLEAVSVVIKYHWVYNSGTEPAALPHPAGEVRKDAEKSNKKQGSPERSVNSNSQAWKENEAKTPQDPPTIFMTYELPHEADPLDLQTLGVNAENVVVVRQVNIQDEIRKVLFIRKSSGGKHDENVRELVFDSHRCLRVNTGLDTFNNLLRGHSEPAEVLLQLFRENYAERCFNQWLAHRLSKLSNLRFRYLDFTRSENGRTLKDTHSSIRFPPADLKILSVDEWWLGEEPKVSAESEPYPLLDLKNMWEPRTDVNNLSPSWQEFWLFELEKAGPSDGEAKRYAVPGHMDYGLFCVNLRRFAELISGPLQLKLFKKADSSSFEGAEPSLNQLLQQLYEDFQRGWKPDIFNAPRREKTVANVGKAWKELVTRIPRDWVKVSQVAGTKQEEQETTLISWFESRSDKADTIVTFLTQDSLETVLGRNGSGRNRGRGRGPGLLWGFSFDLSTRETCVCAFFELAWAFGAEEGFLRDTGAQKDESTREGCVRAIKFLQFLVLERLMPRQGTVEGTRDSLFSRHFYSTVQCVADHDRWDRRGHKDEEHQTSHHGRSRANDLPEPPPKPPAYAPPSLIALPFFPWGDGKNIEVAGDCLFKDIVQRLSKLQKRFSKSEHEPLKTWAGNAQRVIEKLDARVKTNSGVNFTDIGEPTAPITEPFGAQNQPGKSECLRNLTTELMNQLLRLSPRPEGSVAPGDPAGLEATVGDVLELAEVHRLRMELFDPDSGSGSLGDLMGIKPSEKPIRTGYACTGSWMYGVHRTTRSPSLARDILLEITSLEAAEERARRGAGIPARREFFEIHGHEEVPGMEYVSWSELLRNCVARARRRERVLPPEADAAKVYQVIHEQILSCLQRADMSLDRYSVSRNSDEINYPVILSMHEAAEAAFEAILASSTPAETANPTVTINKQ